MSIECPLYQGACAGACFMPVNSDGRMITDAEQRSLASRCVVLQLHLWAVLVIITYLTWFCKAAHNRLRVGKQI
jgi:hypothetical protein